MGFDMEYQAIPEGCKLLEQVRHDAVGGEYIWAYIHHNAQEAIEGAGYFQTSQEGIAFLEEAKRTLEANPGIETRYVSIDRTWDMLCYLLSEKRRTGDNPHTDLGGRAIMGSEKLAPISGQGFPIYYLNPEEVHQVVTLLHKIDYEAFKKNFDPVLMSEASIYKYRQLVSYENALDDVWYFFERLRKFYSIVSEHNEGVIVHLY
jgi:uncharacterized protein DUF1877